MKYIIVFLIVFGSTGFTQTVDYKREYSTYEGTFIRKINIRVIDVAGPSLDETNGSDSTWFADLANSLHYETRNWVVRNFLLFSEGDPFDLFEMYESERLLRESGLFLDALIKVQPTEYTDSVDLNVTTKDKWTINFDLSLNVQKNSYFGLSDDNLMGMGHEVEGLVTRDNDPVTGWGYKVKYSANNVAATFVNITAGIETNNKSSFKVLDLSRPFLTQKIRFAGGLSFRRSDSKLLYVQDDTSSLYPFSNNTFDMWSGYSFPIWFGKEVFRKRTSFISSARVIVSWFGSNSILSPDSNRIFVNSNIYLLSTGLINRSFYKEHYINRFGPTEDIPIGGMIVITGGLEDNENANRSYAGIEGVISKRIDNVGYFSFLTEAGGFHHNKSWEQNAYCIDLLYHSELNQFDGWKLRNFIQNKFLIGNNRLEQEQIFLDTENGLRGHDRFELHGTKRGLLKMESRFFSPYEPLGFALGANVFADFGLISGDGENLFNSRVYQAYGAGLKISNESISEAQFDIALVFRPYTHESQKGSFAILFTGSLLMGSRPISFPRPSIVNYTEN